MKRLNDLKQNNHENIKRNISRHRQVADYTICDILATYLRTQIESDKRQDR